MANKKVSQLVSKPSVLVTDLFPIADPTTGQLFKTTISDLGTAIGSGVSSVNTLVGAVVLDTDDIQELASPTNRWFTDTRARAAISAGTGISYNSGTGVITNAVTSGQIATALGYTPANDANVVKLTGDQTIAGNKTFSAGTKHDNAVLLKHDFATVESGYNTISAKTNGLVLWIGGVTRYHDLLFSTSANYVYTFPSATGTLALTSNLSAYLPLTGGTLTGDLTISSGNPRLYFTDTDNNPDYFISNTDGTFTVYDVTNSTSRFTIGTTGNATFTNAITGGGSITGESIYSNGIVSVGTGLTVGTTISATGSITGASIIRSGGTSSQFLKADGSVDSSVYALDSAVVKLTGNQTIAGVKTFTTGIVADVTTGGTQGFASTNSSTSGSSIFLQNNSTSVGNAIGINNTSTADGISIGNDTSGRAIYISNATASGSGKGISIDNYNGGIGIEVGSDSTADAIKILHLSGRAFNIQSSGGGYGVIINNTTASTSVPFTIQKQGANKIVFTDAGAATFSSTVTSGASGGSNGSYILKRASDGLSVANFSINTVSSLANLSTEYTFLTFSTEGTEKMRISGANVGIGTTAPVVVSGHTSLTVNSSNVARIDMTVSNVQKGLIATTDSSYLILSQGSTPLVLGTNDTERMRITSGGKLLVGTTTAGYGLFSEQRVTINPTNDGIVVGGLGQNYSAYTVQGNNDTGTRYAMYIASGSGTAVGNISFTSTTTLFNSLSDYRLKEDLKPINGLEIVNKINVYDYKWKLNDTRMDGVLAHELAEVLPYAVSGTKDGEQMQTVDYSKIVPVMVQAIKELKAELDTLKNK